MRDVKSGNTQVAPKGATLLFLYFYVVLGLRTPPPPFFGGMDVFIQRGPKIQAMPGSALLHLS